MAIANEGTTPATGTTPQTPPATGTTPPATTQTPPATTEQNTALGQITPKPEGEQPKLGADGKPIEQKKEEAPKAPEKYEAFKMPDGMEADTAAIEAFTPVAKELNLTQDQAQKLVSLQAELQAKAVKDHTASVEAWGKVAAADAEFGGTNYDANLATARKALDEFGTPKLRELFNETGYGNHPELIRFAWKVGKALGESSTRQTGQTAAPTQPRTADVLYGQTHKAG